MFRNENLEMKVGLFIGIGIFLAFVLVFSISDLYMFKEGYNIKVVFDFINGLTVNSPVRLAGVHVGEVEEITIFYDEARGMTRVKLGAKVRKGVKIEKDVIARINTLGLLGEQYLELSPGKASEFLGNNDSIDGLNPVNVGQQMQAWGEVVGSLKVIADRLAKGEGSLGKFLTDESFYNEFNSILGNLSKGQGTLGKLIMDDSIYNGLDSIIGRLSRGEGTIGKLLVKDDVYNDLEYLASDLKSNPWKLLKRSSDTGTGAKKTRGTVVSPK